MRMAVVRMFCLLLVLGTLAHAETHKAKDKEHKARKNYDLADAIDNNVILSKFAALVQASDMGTFMSSRGPFTLFAPTNSAFSKLPPGMFEDLLRPENKTQLQRVVLFHLVNGKSWYAKDLRTVKSLPSCEGNPLTVKTTHAGTVFVAKGHVIRADEHFANGILHEVDTLLMPPQLVLVATTANPAPEASTNAAPAAGTSPGDTNAPTATNAAPDASSSTNAPTVPMPAPAGSAMR
jgi:uncharacterized surface protein with fasciclin (FAS1) repeats